MLGCDVCGQDVEMVLCELFKSVEVSDRGDKSTHAAEPASVTSSASYRKQLTVEELFKGESIILLLGVETGTLWLVLSAEELITEYPLNNVHETTCYSPSTELEFSAALWAFGLATVV